MKDHGIIALFFLALPFLHDSTSMTVCALGEEVMSKNKNNNNNNNSNPFHCTVSANDKDSCVRITHCVWCQGEGLPGICVSEKQEKALIHKIPHVKCFHEDKQEDIPLLFLRGGETGAAPHKTNTPEPASTGTSKITAPYDPKCLNAVWHAAAGSVVDDHEDDDDRSICDTTTDSQGELCRWCDAAGVFQLCLNNEQAHKASSYLQCDIVAEGEKVQQGQKETTFE